LCVGENAVLVAASSWSKTAENLIICIYMLITITYGFHGSRFYLVLELMLVNKWFFLV